MDIVHHTLIGTAGFLTAVAHDQPLLGAAFLAGSVFPDLDVFFMALGKRFYLRNHQGITHSLLLAPLFSALLCIPLWMLPGDKPVLYLWLAAWAGLMFHVVLDWFNTYRIELFGPLSKQRFSLDAVFFINSAALALTAGFYLLHTVLQMNMAEILYPLALVSYLLSKLWLHQHVMHKLRPLFAIPSSLNPFVYYILEDKDNDLHGYRYNALTRYKYDEQQYTRVDEKYYRLAASSPAFTDMQQITRAFRIIETKEDGEGTTIIAADLAVRNFGGRFARTELRFDKQGQLVREMANI